MTVSKDTQIVNMKYPKDLLKRIDTFKEDRGFITRTQAIIYLLHNSLNNEEKINKAYKRISISDSEEQKDSH